MAIDPFQKLKDIWNNYKLKKGLKGSINFPEFKNEVYDWNAEYCHYRSLTKEGDRSLSKKDLQDRYNKLKNLPLLQSNTPKILGIVMIKHAFVEGVEDKENVELRIVVIPIYDNKNINPHITHSGHGETPKYREFSFIITDQSYSIAKDAYKSLGGAPTISDYYGPISENIPV